MRILVTGATGFVGPHLVRRLAAQHKIGVLLRVSARKERLANIDPAPQALIWDGSAQGMLPLVAEFKPDCAIHLACSYIGSHNPADIDSMVESNIRFPTLLLEALARSGCRDFISTGSIYQHCRNADYAPLDFFASTKQAFANIVDFYVQAGEIKHALTLELSDTYGPNDPRQKLIQLLQKTAGKGETLGMSPGEQYIDLVHVEDVVRAYEHALTMLPQLPEGKQKTYAVRSGKAITVKKLAELFNDIHTPPANIEWGKRAYHGREFMQPWTQGETLPGWQPSVDLRAGLTDLLKA